MTHNFDFYSIYYENPRVKKWNQYTILKCTKSGNNSFYESSITNYYMPKQIKHSFEILKKLKTFDIPTNIPEYSFSLTIDFKLKKPYISRDDEIFYPKENPLSKEKVFKIPYIRASSWKGNLRWMATKLFADKILEGDKEERKTFKERAKIVRIFGTEKENVSRYLNRITAEKVGKKPEEIQESFIKYLREKEYIGKNIDSHRGRLQTYPTYFNRINLEIINPHDRKTKAGTVPIQIEAVPEDTKGTFNLFYYPFDLLAKLYGDENKRKNAEDEIKEDLIVLRNVIVPLLTVYGFSAKKTSGYGVIKRGSFDFKVNQKHLRITSPKGRLDDFDKLAVEGLE